MVSRRQVVAVKAMIIRSARLLILRRRDSDDLCPNQWDLPGGRIRWGEDLEEGLRREVLEETGLRILELRPVAVWQILATPDLQIVGITSLTRIRNGRVSLSYEHTDYRWIKPEQARVFDMNNSLRANILRYAHESGVGRRRTQ